MVVAFSWQGRCSPMRQGFARYDARAAKSFGRPNTVPKVMLIRRVNDL
ncbi:MAG: hypothetical protein OJF61_002542 [Rhodanobacteraceae bacterium]|nr:MAG: hypothetical protein OJF61_002542 [Rhodanobacteraceae bacterium]